MQEAGIDPGSEISLHGTFLTGKTKIARFSPLKTALPAGRQLMHGISSDGIGFEGDEGVSLTILHLNLVLIVMQELVGVQIRA